VRDLDRADVLGDLGTRRRSVAHAALYAVAATCTDMYDGGPKVLHFLPYFLLYPAMIAAVPGRPWMSRANDETYAPLAVKSPESRPSEPKIFAVLACSSICSAKS
jgi:hypothetical protein